MVIKETTKNIDFSFFLEILGRLGKAYYPATERESASIVLDDGVLDHRLHAKLFTVSGPRDRVIIRKNYPETWLWDATTTGYKIVFVLFLLTDKKEPLNG